MKIRSLTKKERVIVRGTMIIRIVFNIILTVLNIIALLIPFRYQLPISPINRDAIIYTIAIIWTILFAMVLKRVPREIIGGIGVLFLSYKYPDRFKVIEYDDGRTAIDICEIMKNREHQDNSIY